MSDRKAYEQIVSFILDGKKIVMGFYSHGCGYSCDVDDGDGFRIHQSGGVSQSIEASILEAKFCYSYSYFQGAYSYEKSFEYAEKHKDLYGQYKYGMDLKKVIAIDEHEIQFESILPANPKSFLITYGLN